MRLTVAVFALLIVSAGGTLAAQPIYLDQLMEMSLSELQQQFSRVRNENCYQIGADRFLMIDMDKKDQKPWRVALATVPTCRRSEEGPALEIRDRAGLTIGLRTKEVLDLMGRPDASAPPDAAFKKLGETEYFYICRVSAGCARHTSVFMRGGVVTAIANWYSE